MRHVRRTLGLFLVLVAIATSCLAASKSQPEFDKIKSLAGNWEGKGTAGNPVQINYRVVSGGTAVVESILEKPEAEMITVYYLDGDRLMLTHYCMANNQPRMRADAPASNPATIKFSFVDATNLSSPDDGHMDAHSIEWKDADHVNQHWTWRQKGGQKVETFELHRTH